MKLNTDNFSFEKDHISFTFTRFSGSILFVVGHVGKGNFEVFYDVWINENGKNEFREEFSCLDEAIAYVNGYLDKVLVDAARVRAENNIEKGKHCRVPVPEGTKYIHVELSSPYVTESERFVNVFDMSDEDVIDMWNSSGYDCTALDGDYNHLGDNTTGAYDF